MSLPNNNNNNTTMDMDDDQDDDLKINNPNLNQSNPPPSTQSKPLSLRQQKFLKFKQLHNQMNTNNSNNNNNNDDNKNDDDIWSKKKSKHGRKKLNKSKKFKKIQKKRSNSLTRDDNNYIYFHNKSSGNNTNSSSFDALNIETSTLNINKSSQLKFDELSKKKNSKLNINRLNTITIVQNTVSYRSIRVPGHKMIHIRRLWKDICEPIVKSLKLQIRMNSRKNLIELRLINKSDILPNINKNVKSNLQKGSDFINAIVLGFEIKDSLSLIRMDDIFLESFDIRDVKFFNKKSDHWMRAIGRIAGQYGKIKYSIENSTNTRIIIFGFKIYILGSFSSIRLARNSISRLIIGSSPGNVYAKLRVVSNRLKHKF